MCLDSSGMLNGVLYDDYPFVIIYAIVCSLIRPMFYEFVFALHLMQLPILMWFHHVVWRYSPCNSIPTHACDVCQGFLLSDLLPRSHNFSSISRQKDSFDDIGNLAF